MTEFNKNFYWQTRARAKLTSAFETLKTVQEILNTLKKEELNKKLEKVKTDMQEIYQKI